MTCNLLCLGLSFALVSAPVAAVPPEGETAPPVQEPSGAAAWDATFVPTRLDDYLPRKGVRTRVVLVSGNVEAGTEAVDSLVSALGRSGVDDISASPNLVDQELEDEAAIEAVYLSDTQVELTVLVRMVEGEEGETDAAMVMFYLVDGTLSAAFTGTRGQPIPRNETAGVGAGLAEAVEESSGALKPKPVGQSRSSTSWNPEITDRTDRKKRGRAKALVISGFTIFGAAYLTSAVAGAVWTDYDGRLTSGGGRMMIPVGGPFAAIPETGSATGAFFAGLLGVLQTGGLAMGIAGAVMLGRANSKRRQVSFHMGPTRDGWAAGLAGRF